MSRRSKRRREPQAAGGEAAPGGGRAAGAPGGRPAAEHGRAAQTGGKPAATWSLGLQILLLAVVFAVAVVVAELAGAANLGVALGVGQIAFAIAVIYLLIRR